MVSGVSIVARIGPVARFHDADALIAYAGLAPGDSRVGPDTAGRPDRRWWDRSHLRHYLIEATDVGGRLPRYKRAYERMRKRRGQKVGRLVVARMLVRSIYKMLKEGVEFDARDTDSRRRRAN